MKMRGAFLSLLDQGISFRGRILALLVLFGCMASAQVSAQIFGLSVTNANGTNSLSVNTPVTFVINLTNQSGVDLLSVLVTNDFVGPASPQFVSATKSQGSTFTNASSVLFDLGTMVSGGFAQLSVTVKPAIAGSFTNSVVVASPFGTNIATTNVVILATPAPSDIAVLLTPPPVTLVGE